MYRNGYFSFWCALLFCPFPSAMLLHKGSGGLERELLVAILQIANISNKATGMFNKSEPFETYPFEGFR